jgi:hypothetical protein
MARRCGWAPKGERCRAAIPQGVWKTVTSVGGLTLAAFIAPILLDRPMDGACFLAALISTICRRLNPIENAFATFKAHGRNSAARTLDALERAAANALQQFKHDECANFFAHAGYGLD